MSHPPLFKNYPVLIKGAGDLASGVAYRLKRSGFPLIMTELARPRMVRRTVCFGEAIYSGQTRVEGVVARRIESVQAAQALAQSDAIPILIDPEAKIKDVVKPPIIVDAIMAKANTGTTITDAPLVIALGPGFTAGQDCHAAIETKRGHWLGRVIDEGSAEPNTGLPGRIKDQTAGRVLRAPTQGKLTPAAEIGATIKQGQCIATVDGQEIRAPFQGVLRGLIHPDVPLTPGLKIGDLDPRADPRYCFTISDKSLSIGGGVLEAILASGIINQKGD